MPKTRHLGDPCPSHGGGSGSVAMQRPPQPRCRSRCRPRAAPPEPGCAGRAHAPAVPAARPWHPSALPGAAAGPPASCGRPGRPAPARCGERGHSGVGVRTAGSSLLAAPIFQGPRRAAGGDALPQFPPSGQRRLQPEGLALLAEEGAMTQCSPPVCLEEVSGEAGALGLLRPAGRAELLQGGRQHPGLVLQRLAPAR